MSLLENLLEVIARPAPAKRAASLLDSVLWRVLAGLAIVFLILAFWRVLEHALGPILAPLVMALTLAIIAAVLAFIESRRKRKQKAEAPVIAPLVATLLEIAFAPKLVRWFAIGSLLYDTFINGTGPLAAAKGKARGRK